MADTRETNKTLDNSETRTKPIESRSVGEQTELGVVIEGTEEQFKTVVRDIAELEQEVKDDIALSDEDRQELLVKAERIKSGIQARWRIFWKKFKAAGYDFFRKAGEPWHEDLELESEKDESVNLERIQKNLAVASLRLQYIRENKLYDVSDRCYDKKSKKKNQESKTAWLSAWNHLVYASKSLEHLLVDNDNEKTKGLVEKNTEAAYNFWKTILDLRLPGKKPSDIEFFITGKSEDGEIPIDFFASMPKTLRKGFHKAYLEWLNKGFLNRHTLEIRNVTSRDVTPYTYEGDLMCAYPDYLNKSFNFEDLLSVLAKVEPAHSEEDLLGLDENKQTYRSLHGEGLENKVANMAIHRAALQTAGISTDSWHGDDTKILAEIRKQTETALPVFLENLYESLKDHPTALIQAFKGLLKIPTRYFSPAGSLKKWAGYEMYSEERKTFVSSFKNFWDGLHTFEEQSQQMKSFVFKVSSSTDYNTVLNFILEKGKTNKSLNTIGEMFVDRIDKAVKEEDSATAKSIDSTLVSEFVHPIKRFTSFFPGTQLDGGKFFNAYLERLQRDGVDILTKIDGQILSEIEQMIPSARRIIFDFADIHHNQNDAAEVIEEYARHLHTFIKTFGFFENTSFECYHDQLAKGHDILASVNKEQIKIISHNELAKKNFVDFFVSHSNQDDAAEVIGEYVRHLNSFIDTVGFFNNDCFEFYHNQLTKGHDILANVNKEQTKIINYNELAKKNFVDFFVSHSNQDNAAEAIGERVRQIHTFIDYVSFFDNACFEGYRGQLAKGHDILASVNKEQIKIINHRELAKKNFVDFFVSHSNQDDATEVIGEYIRQIHFFIKTVGFFHENAFRIATRDSKTSAQSLTVLTEIPADLSDIIKVRILDTYEIWLGIPKEKRESYIQVLSLLDQTPSQEIKRIANELMASIIESDDPLDSWQKIEAIFIKNNLPLVGKIYKIFQTLHPSKKITETLAGSSTLSPYLRQVSPKRREYTIFSDLLKVHIESGNRSLRQYLEILKEGEAFFDILEKQEDNEVSLNDQKRLQMYIAKLNTVFFESQMGIASSQITTAEAVTISQMRKTYRSLHQSLGVKAEQSISDRVVEMFANRLGYKSINEVLTAMHDKKQKAHKRGLRYAHDAVSGQLQFFEGDILKGVDQQYIASILQNGSVAKEYLGSGSSQDLTPYDTDVEVIGTTKGQSFSQTISDSLAEGYGDILFVIRDRGQFIKTSAKTSGQIDPNKLELFKTGILDERHHGIRTGFPTTEVDFIVCKSVTKIPDYLSLEIVQNGYYIPVADKTGKIIFTPEQYDLLRSFYTGLDRFDGLSFVYEQTKETSHQYADVQKARSHLRKAREQVDEATKNIQNSISEVLHEQGVELKKVFDTSLLGAELFDTGSTGRHTNLPGSFDFDLALKLDLSDEDKINKILTALRERWSPVKDNSYSSNTLGDLFQLRFEGAQIGQASLDIDIAFVRKSELSVYGSHDAIKEKLSWVQKHFGDEAQEDIVANIIVAKEVLKKAEAYKKLEHGGMGGIGVENWLLAHSGNFEQAAKAFWQAAHGRLGEVRSLEDFQNHYQVIDPGVNVKFQTHDNFVLLLKEQGYINMLKAIGGYFGWK